jgi:N-acetylglutamate synthase-like GNAT family acetyltransferase
MKTSATATVVLATPGDLDAIKALADAEKAALGFVHRGALLRALARDEVLVAKASDGRLVGFCHYYRRRDGVITIYHLAVARLQRGAGCGRALLTRLLAPEVIALRAKCPADLEANAFYARVGFQLATSVPAANDRRGLNVWELHVQAPTN